MKLRYLALLALFVTSAILLASAVAVSQTSSAKSPMPSINCQGCHTCEVPTVKDPCLKTCPRSQMVHRTGRHALGDAPDSMLLDDIAELYQPVHFNHKLHAGMAQMGKDCATCHHYSPPGQVPPCKDCHTPSSLSTDLSKPNLKGAYHRQCLACHREWSHDTKCYVCHAPVPGGRLDDTSQDPTDIMGKSHPVINVPAKRTYTTPYKPGPVVTFQHKEHIDLFGFRCVDCHKQENCGHCHDIQQTSVVAKTQEQVHAICNDCHGKDECSKCHDTKERPGFTHNSTGWPLNPYHSQLDCWTCHPTGKRIAKLNKMCANCHKGWTPENFQHAVTGLQLDETHAELDCESCHPGRKFESNPVCSDCHDDGRTPADAPPGMKVKQTDSAAKIGTKYMKSSAKGK